MEDETLPAVIDNSEIITGRDARGRFGLGNPGGKRKPAVFRAAHEIAKNLSVNPLEIALQALKTGKWPALSGQDARKLTSPEYQRLVVDTLPYLHPKLTATELTGRDGGPIEVERRELHAIMADPALCAAAQDIAIVLAGQGARTPEPSRIGPEYD